MAQLIRVMWFLCFPNPFLKVAHGPWMDEHVCGYVNGWMDVQIKCMDGCACACLDGWMDEWIHVCIDGCICA